MPTNIYDNTAVIRLTNANEKKLKDILSKMYSNNGYVYETSGNTTTIKIEFFGSQPSATSIFEENFQAISDEYEIRFL